MLVTSVSITPLVDSSLSMLNPALWVPGKGSYLLVNVIHTLRSTAAIFNYFICWVFIWLCHCCRMLFFQRLLTLEAADLYSCCLFAEFFNSWFRRNSWLAQVRLNRFLKCKFNRKETCIPWWLFTSQSVGSKSGGFNGASCQILSPISSWFGICILGLAFHRKSLEKPNLLSGHEAPLCKILNYWVEKKTLVWYLVCAWAKCHKVPMQISLGLETSDSSVAHLVNFSNILIMLKNVF